MAGKITEDRANSILKMLFEGIESDELTKTQVLGKITEGTYFNYMPRLVEYGLLKRRLNRKDKRATAVHYLTNKGRTVLGRPVKSQLGSTWPVQTEVLPKSGPTRTELSLDEVTEITDRFNSQSHNWRWVLIRNDSKESPMTKS